MTEILEDKKVITPVTVGATNSQTYEYLIYFIFGFVETLLVFRLLLKLAGASQGSSFVNLIYGITNLLVQPFVGIFGKIQTFEPTIVVAIIVYAMLGWGIVKLVRIGSGDKETG
jgi:hypothetical protein